MTLNLKPFKVPYEVRFTIDHSTSKYTFFIASFQIYLKPVDNVTPEEAFAHLESQGVSVMAQDVLDTEICISCDPPSKYGACGNPHHCLEEINKHIVPSLLEIAKRLKLKVSNFRFNISSVDLP